MRRLLAYALVIPLAALISCQKDPQSGKDASPRELTVLIGTDGFGDGCYNDTMLAGILGFCKAHPEVSLNLCQPESIADAGNRLDAWLADESGRDRALILASNSYSGILQGKPVPGGGRVLLLETDDVFPGYSSYIIRRYGASWLCGAMSGYFTAVVLKAMDGNNMIDESESGFRNGYNAVSTGLYTSWTLADGPEGFAMRDSTYRFIYNNVEEYIYTQQLVRSILFFPLLGGSLPGVFDYSRYNGFVSIAGMDVDCAAYNPIVVPYSLCIHNDKVLRNYLEDWVDGKPWPGHAQFGLESEYVEVVINPDYWFTDQDRRDMNDLYREYYPRAVEMEEAYAAE